MTPQRTRTLALCLAAAMLATGALKPVEAPAEGLSLPNLTHGTVSPQPKLPRPNRYHQHGGYRPRRRAGQLLILSERIHPLDRLEPPEDYRAPPPEPVEPVATPPTEAEADPADPRAPSRRVPARGRLADSPATPEPGQRLSASAPRVTLNWRSYDLPEPPVGALYVRLGRQILLIDQTDRRVLGYYDPALGQVARDPGAG